MAISISLFTLPVFKFVSPLFLPRLDKPLHPGFEGIQVDGLLRKVPILLNAPAKFSTQLQSL